MSLIELRNFLSTNYKDNFLFLPMSIGKNAQSCYTGWN